MENLGRYQRRSFLKDHPPVMQRMLIASSDSEQTFLPGTVFGEKTGGKFGPWETTDTTGCILAEDVVVPTAGDAYALCYVHAALVAGELIWPEALSATDQNVALGKLRSLGLYASEV